MNDRTEMGQSAVGNSSEPQIAEILMSDVKKDLHIHTCYSDGVLTPEEVVDRWQDEGYKLIAVTDHDGIEGSVIAMEYAAGMEIQVVSGAEFDSACDLGRELHILGYGFDFNCPQLRSSLLDLTLMRARRNDRIMQMLNDRGYRITLDDIGAENEGRYVGKPTFARILYRKGYISDPVEAFRTVFREPGLREIVKETLTTKEIIDLIHTAGGVAVFAHPTEQRHLPESFEEFKPRMYQLLDRMREYGIDGIECRHPSADDVQQDLLTEYAERYGLLKTGGSDFHSDDNPRNFAKYHRP